ncbi:hypothetical protein BD626DRAFT_156251 [Schizophyllum amplum]|uniref:Uncharacterized protein n=1 Tax=Schizophyllum amplum TaxID=97359 RepID=A0A550BRJ1_9AGAR|nr:hypothetical protein BD626DRAFT_156251 [Auriculariopsis ampla]
MTDQSQASRLLDIAPCASSRPSCPALKAPTASRPPVDFKAIRGLGVHLSTSAPSSTLRPPCIDFTHVHDFTPVHTIISLDNVLTPPATSPMSIRQLHTHARPHDLHSHLSTSPPSFDFTRSSTSHSSPNSRPSTGFALVRDDGSRVR